MDIDSARYVCPNGRLRLSVGASAFTDNFEATSDVLGRLAGDRGLEHLVLDLEALTVLDSRAVRLLVELKQALSNRGASLTLENVHCSVRRLLEHLRLSEFLLPMEDCDDALTAAGAASAFHSGNDRPGLG